MRTRWFHFLVLLSLVSGLVPVTAVHAALEIAPLAQPATQAGADVEVEPALLNQLASDETTGYLIYFKEKPDLSPAHKMDWIERGRFVANALHQTALRSQAQVRAHLDTQGVKYQAFWIDNVIVVESAPVYTINQLMAFPEIEALRERRQPMLYEPVGNVPAAILAGIEPNLTHINVDQVWGMGYTGSGFLVGSIDTGVRYTHAALVNQYRGNLGGGLFDHNYSWWDPYQGTLEPFDFHDHGSHTVGTMIGSDGGENQIGMAPDAQWIACKSFQGGNVDVQLLSCGQFMAAPWDLTGANSNPDLRPHVVNNSWGDCGRSYDPWYEGVLGAWHAAGIYPVFSNGNASNCSYASPPGLNTVGNPARAGNVTGVGSTGRDNGQYATYSNWGPTDNPDAVNPRGYPYLKPQVVAPGTNRSAGRNSDTHYRDMSGTSMAGPHVAGLIPLMWQAGPCLVGDYATTETLIEMTAIPIPYATGNGDEGPGDVPNHATGWGEIDALAAVQAAIAACGDSVIAGQVTDSDTGNPIANAKIQAVSAEQTAKGKSGVDGFYSIFVYSDTYTLSATAFGYLPVTVPGVVATTDMTTTQDIQMESVQWHTVSGQVTDAATGWPLYAQINFPGYPVPAVWTNPVDGSYSVQLPGGVTYTFDVAAWVPGYEIAHRVVGPFASNMTQDIELDANPATCNAPGYELEGLVTLYTEDFVANDGDYEPGGTPPAEWQWGTPVTWPGACASGAHCWGTNLNGNYAHNANTWITSPVIDLSGESAPLTVSWWQAWHIESAAWDKGYAEMRINGGPWRVMWEHTGGTIQVNWTEMSYDISAAAGGDVQFRFRLTSDSSVAFNGYYIDLVTIISEDCNPPADGGLVVGNVYDAPLGGPLVGAVVSNDSGEETIAVATDDPAVDDAFYTLFSPAGARVFTATMAGGYADEVVDVVVVDGGTVAQDFYLAAGYLVPSPEGFEVTLESGGNAKRWLTIENQGGADASFLLVELPGGDIPWLSKQPVSGTVSTGAQQSVLLTFDASLPEASQPGTYYGTLQMNTDTPYPPATLPITMHVTPPATWGKLAGVVTGLGYCDLDPAPLQGALLTIESGTGLTWNLETEADGAYQLWLDAALSPLTVTVEAGAHITRVFNNVIVTGATTTTHDMALRWDAPCVGSDPQAVHVTVGLGMTTTMPFTITNIGAAATDFELAELNRGYTIMSALPTTVPVISGRSDPAWAEVGTPVESLVERVPATGVAPADIGDAWETMAPLPAGRVFNAVVADTQGYVYVIGGTSDGGASNPTNTTFRYNTATNTWDTMATMPAALDSVAGVEINGKIYIPGDATTANTFVYDIAMNTWSTLATSGGYTARSQYQVVALGTDLYVLGGIVAAASASTTEVWKLDTTTGVWTASVPMQKSRTSFSAGAIGGEIYVAGGVAFPGFGPDMTAEKFDGTAWSYIAGVPSGGGAYTRWSYNAASVGKDGLWLAAGRRDAGWDVLNHAGYYNPATDTWTDSPAIPTLAQGRVYMDGTVATDGYFYVIGGRDGAGSVAYTNNERLYVGYAGSGLEDGDIPWLSEEPTSGVVPADGTFAVELTFEATEAVTVTQPGNYFGTLFVNSDDPINNRIPVPVTMTVTPPATWGKLLGTVTSLGYCDVDPAPVAGMDVLVEHSDGMTWTLTTDVSGTYQLWLESGTLTVTVEAPAHEKGEAIVTLAAGETITQNFGLRWLVPCVGATPAGLHATLELGATATEALTLTNTGAVDTDWDIEEENFDVVWLAQDPLTGTLVADTGVQVVDVDFDASVVDQPGEYVANLWLASDDPFSPIILPVTMTVTPPADWAVLAGTVYSSGYCDAEMNPLEGAEVTIENGISTVLLTNEDGVYSYWLAPGTYTVTATAPEHLAAAAEVVVITTAISETQDFVLGWEAPCVAVAPLSIADTLPMGESSEHVLTITNNGAGTLDFEFREWDFGYLMPQGVQVLAEPQVATQERIVIGDFTLGRNPQPQAGPQASAPTARNFPRGIYALTHSLSQVIMANNTVACGAGGIHADNSYLRIFDLDDFGLYKGLEIFEVELGIETATAGDGVAQPLEVRLYTLEGELVWDNLMLIGSAGITVTDQTLTHITVPVTGSVHAGEVLVVEIFLPDGAPDSNRLYIGSNNHGQTAPSYIAAEACGIAEPVTLASLGFGGVHVIMNVIGEAPDLVDVPWLSQMPEMGNVPPYSSTQVTVTLDAGQVLQPGTYFAELDVLSNDAHTPAVVVPVVMTATLSPDYGELAGTVSGLGHCDLHPTLLAGAEILVETSTGMAYTLVTEKSGAYSAWFNETVNPITLTVSADGHVTQIITGINVVSGTTTLMDIDLRALLPCFESLVPTDAHVTLALGMSTTVPMTLTNIGAGDLDWKVSEVDGGFALLAADTILVVNHGGFNINAADAFALALDNLGYAYDRVSSASATGIPATLTDYAAVLYAGIPGAGAIADQLIAYLDGGGNLLVADNDFGWSMGSHILYTQYFQATYLLDAGSKGPLVGVDIMEGIDPDITSDPFPDSFALNGPDAVGIFANTSPRLNWAGSRIERNDYRAIYLAWDFHYAGGSAIGDPVETDIVAAALGWMIGPGVPWLDEAPKSGVVPGDNTTVLTVTFDAGVPEVTQPGDYFATLVFETDDATFSEVQVPVTMTVIRPETWGKLDGTVIGLGYCNAEPAPLEDAVIFIESAVGQPVEMLIDVDEIWAEDFEVDDGDFIPTGVRGDWEWGTPTVWPNACAWGDNCWGTRLGGNYGNNANEVLTSPVITLTEIAPGTPLTVTWQQAWHIESATFDRAFAEVSVNGGDWAQMWVHSGPTTQVDWTEIAYDISDAAGGTVQFRWRLISDSSVNYAGYYIDDVQITTPVFGIVMLPINWTVTTDSEGDYGLWLDEMYSPLTVTISYEAGYEAQLFTDVEIVSGTVTTLDAELRWYHACVSLLEDMDVTLGLGMTTTVAVNIANTGAYTAFLTFGEQDTGFTPAPLAELLRAGGPDTFGYTFADSTEDLGPVFDFVDISTVGVPLGLGDDEAVAVSLGFTFNYYNNNYTEVYVSSNGLLSFGAPATQFINAPTMPSPALPNNIIAVMWDDLMPGPEGEIYIRAFGRCPYGNGACLVVQYDNLIHADGKSAGVWQAILFRTGSILLQYASAGELAGASSTTGIENFFGADGLLYAANTPDSLHDGLAVCFSYPGRAEDCVDTDIPWLTLDALNANISADSSFNLTLGFDAGVPEVVEPGDYTGYIWLLSNDPIYPWQAIQVTMTVEIPETWGRLEGAVLGWDHCDSAAFELAEAPVLIRGTDGAEWTLYTDISGTYGIWLDEGHGPFTITVAHTGYVSKQTTGVEIVAGVATTEDFELRLDAPCFATTPETLNFTLTHGHSGTHALTLHNTGAGGLHITAVYSESWATSALVTGTLDPDSEHETYVTFGAQGLAIGTHHGTLVFESNDPLYPQLTVPLTLTVMTPTLEVELTATPMENVFPGDTITYRITLTNTSDGPLPVDLLDTIPVHTTYVPGSATGGLQYTEAPGGSYVGWSGTLTLDEVKAFTFAVRVDTAYTWGQIDNAVDIAFAEQLASAVVTVTVRSFELNVRTEGQGEVVVAPDVTRYRYAQTVTLTAEADPGWTFTGWSGDAITTTNPLVVEIVGNTVITATFTQDAYALDVPIVGEGDVARDPDQATYHYGDAVTLTATADPGWTFAGWSGDLGAAEVITITIEGNTIITATFTQMTVCVDVLDVTLTQVTTGPINPGNTVEFNVAASPTNATLPFSYTLAVGGPVLTAHTNPFTFTQTFAITGTHTITVAVWNCAMSEPVSDTLDVVIVAPRHTIYLPVVLRAAP